MTSLLSAAIDVRYVSEVTAERAIMLLSTSEDPKPVSEFIVMGMV